MKVFLFIMVISSCFANESIDNWNDEVINQICANENACVEAYADEKIYLNPDRIFPTKNGLFLNLNDSEIQNR